MEVESARPPACPPSWSWTQLPQSSSNVSHSSGTSDDGVFSRNETTSPSTLTSPDSPSSLWWPQPKAKSLDLARDYLPLGVLFRRSYVLRTASEQDVASQRWTEWDVPVSVLITDFFDQVWHSIQRLMLAKWIKVYVKELCADRVTAFRIYLLPHDVGRSCIERSSNSLNSALDTLMASINVSPQAWSDPDSAHEQQHFDRWATADKQSLFYMFNTLPSPSPQSERIQDKYSRLAVEELLDPASWVPGLKTALYPYQARSAALMVQRETAPELQLDPRLELRHAPDGQPFYYGARAGLFLKNPRYYEANKGGILAETMVDLS